MNTKGCIDAGARMSEFSWKTELYNGYKMNTYIIFVGVIISGLTKFWWRKRWVFILDLSLFSQMGHILKFKKMFGTCPCQG